MFKVKKSRIVEIQGGAISKLLYGSLYVYVCAIIKDSGLSSQTDAQTIQQLMHIDLGYISAILRKNDVPTNQEMKQPDKQVANQPTEKSFNRLTKRANKPTNNMATPKEKSAKLGPTSVTN